MIGGDLVYARGYALLHAVAAGDQAGFSDSDIEWAKRAAEVAWLFTPDQLQLDGWRRDPVRHVWIPPVRDDMPVDPIRSVGRDPGPRDGGGGRGGVRPAPSPAAPADLAGLSDAELEHEIEAADIWDRWMSDPEGWRHRWDRRAVLLARRRAEAQ